MLSTSQLALAVVVVAVITFCCRIAPFALLRGRRSELVDFLSRTMPLGVMIVLIAYTLDGVDTTPSTWVPALGGIAATAALHLWRRQIGLSLVGGTGVYVALSLVLG